jgi:hypothetical protein
VRFGASGVACRIRMASEHAKQEITSLEDVPSAARIAHRQRFLQKWYRVLALAPFGVVVYITLRFFGDKAATPLLMAPIYASLIWAVGVAIYTLYLTFFSFRCPVCGWRFGSGEKCSTCGLPRSRNAVNSNILDITSLPKLSDARPRPIGYEEADKKEAQ